MLSRASGAGFWRSGFKAKKFFALLVAALVSSTGCATKTDRHLKYLTPFDRTASAGAEFPGKVYIKEKNGIQVSTMVAVGKKNRLLILSVAVMNQTDHMIRVQPEQVYLALNRGFLIPALAPEQIVNRRVSGGDASSVQGLVGSIPYHDPYGIGSAVSGASSVYQRQRQGGKGEMVHIVSQRLLRGSNLPPGFGTQGLLYYDPVGYDIQRGELPITVLIEVENEKFLFEFLPEKN